MGSLGVLFDRKVRYIAAAVALLLTMVLPTLVSAAQITSRSVALSSASAGATGVTYQVKFTATATGAADAFVVDFCNESPLIGSTCTAPAGFNASAADSNSAGVTDVSLIGSNNHQLVVTRDITNSEAVTVDLEGITNPTDSDTIYARIVTYGSAADAADYTSTDVSGSVDAGGVAIPITSTTSVSGAVLETLQFCALGANAPTAGCANAATPGNEPVLRLGELIGGVRALSDNISEGTIYTQISTNAANGAVVSLKSANTCGGLKRVSAATCDIAAANDNVNPVATGSASFGMRIEAGTDFGSGDSGAYQINGSFYNDSSLLFNYVAGGASGVTSTYGDQILNTNNLPASNKNMNLIFGASSSASTPAGNYANDISLIATGTF